MELKPRALKRKEIKQLRDKGVALLSIAPETIDAHMDAVLDIVFPTAEEQAVLDDMTMAEISALWQQVLKETVAGLQHQKNL